MTVKNLDPIPGTAQDDFDRLRILFLRERGLDLAVRFEIGLSTQGAKWTLTIAAGGQSVRHEAGCLTACVTGLVVDLSRKILLRWRSDGGALQLCGIEVRPFDPPEPLVVDGSGEESEPSIERRSLPRRARA